MHYSEVTRDHHLQQFLVTRHLTEKLCQPLLVEDYVIQAMEDVSPVKWHLAHTTWFFETFLLQPYLANYKAYDPLYAYLFNSYYQSIGTPYPRVKRGLLSRPSVEKIYAYRHHVNEYMTVLFSQTLNEVNRRQFIDILMLGINHEQQHQELLITDLKFNFYHDPSFPVYAKPNKYTSKPSALDFLSGEKGVFEIGCDGSQFCFDNELPKHKIYVNPFALASRLVTNAEYLEFVEAGGYQNPKWWLADGWHYIQQEKWQSPLYWILQNKVWHQYTLHGLSELKMDEPVIHISFYEADAYARFRQCRLPREYEWELLVEQRKLTASQANLLEIEHYHAKPQMSDTHQFFGDAWEWTCSPYAPYPGYQPLRGALGEYNGKFMCNQLVLKGGSCVTPKSHIRASYRNFFQPEKRWQFTGIRLAKDL